MSKDWYVEEKFDMPGTCRINEHEHLFYSIVSDAGADTQFDGTGIAVVIWPIESDSPEVREERYVKAKRIAEACNLLREYDSLVDSSS